MMTASALRVSATTLTLLIAGAAALMSAPKPPTSVPATATFRCYSEPGPPTTPCVVATDQTVATTADHVGDEGAGRTYTGGVLGGGFYLKITDPSRAFRLFLHPALPAPFSRSDECDAPGALAACNPDDRLPTLGGLSMLLADAEVSIKVLNGTAPFADASGGLPAMACNAPGLALVHFTTWLPGGEGHWGLNFNRRAYHSTGATITRVANKTWVVEASTSQDAELVSFGHSGISRRQGPSHEGRYQVPFQLTIETTALPSGSATPCPS